MFCFLQWVSKNFRGFRDSSTRKFFNLTVLSGGHPKISYLNAPNQWRLADNSRPPNKKLFEEVTYDKVRAWDDSEFLVSLKNQICCLNLEKDTRRFCGSIYWGDNPFKTKSSVRWDYDFVFSEDFTTIESGSICEMDQNDVKIGEGTVILQKWDRGHKWSEITQNTVVYR